MKKICSYILTTALIAGIPLSVFASEIVSSPKQVLANSSISQVGSIYIKANETKKLGLNNANIIRYEVFGNGLSVYKIGDQWYLYASPDSSGNTGTLKEIFWKSEFNTVKYYTVYIQ
ncbi:hypothetical protein J5TS2_05700 [Brevibacillus halotolerans]|uniref:hypothetical protein n=1 Tax=Brevibacillus halotolerans TaxID=1507437 RepID=UPI001B06A3D8|nr:hypothetical protein [Brevibacillus halotolerans]GIN99901.1 hypothetical protein J5TS2_05700 [Brevibacillus halotolerans]